MDKNKIKRYLGFSLWLFGRILFYIKANKLPQWPYRYRWLRPHVDLFGRVFPENPIRAIKFCRKLFHQEIPNEGFILLVCGPRILRDGLKVCESIGVKPFLTFGTLLGFMREKDFISHDEDVDLGLMNDDFQKKHLIKEAMLKKGYKLRINDDYMLSFIHPRVPGLFIDFSRVYQKDNHMVIRILSEDDQNTLFSYYFPIETMCKFRKVNFQRNKVFIPMEPDKWLSVVYGEWQIPQKKFNYQCDHKNLKIEKLKN